MTRTEEKKGLNKKEDGGTRAREVGRDWEGSGTEVEDWKVV